MVCCSGERLLECGVVVALGGKFSGGSGAKCLDFLVEIVDDRPVVDTVTVEMVCCGGERLLECGVVVALGGKFSGESGAKCLDFLVETIDGGPVRETFVFE